MKFESFGWLAAVALAGMLFVAQPQRSGAALSYTASQSSATITHDPDVNAAGVPQVGSGGLVATTNYKLSNKTNPKTFTPTNSIPSPPAFNFATKHTQGTSTSNATASVAQITNATTAGAKLGAGTGVSQVNKGAYSGASSLRIDIDMLWTNGSTQFGPPASGIANFVVGGNVGVNAGSFAAFDAVLNFQDPNAIIIGSEEASILSPFPNYRSTVEFHDEWRRGDTDVSGTGAFSKTFSTSQLFTDPFGNTEAANILEPFDQVRIVGFIEFRAFNSSTTTSSILALPRLDDPDGTVIGFEADSGIVSTTNDAIVFQGAIPEPASAGLVAMAGLALAARVLRRRAA